MLFLIEGHAFPGYWRSPEQADYFVQGDYPDGQTEGDELTEDNDYFFVCISDFKKQFEFQVELTIIVYCCADLL